MDLRTNISVMNIQQLECAETLIDLDDTFLYFTEDVFDKYGKSHMQGYRALATGLNKKEVSYDVAPCNSNCWCFSQYLLVECEREGYSMNTFIIEVDSDSLSEPISRNEIVKGLATFLNMYHEVTIEHFLLYIRQLAKDYKVALKVLLPCAYRQVISVLFFDFTKSTISTTDRVYVNKTEGGKTILISKYNVNEDRITLYAKMAIEESVSNRFDIYRLDFLALHGNNDALKEICNYITYIVNSENKVIILKGAIDNLHEPICKIVDDVKIVKVDRFIAFCNLNTATRTFIFSTSLDIDIPTADGSITSLDELAKLVSMDFFKPDTVYIIKVIDTPKYIREAVASIIKSVQSEKSVIVI